MFKPQYNKDESYIVRARCSLCNVQLPKMTLTNFKAFVCVCQRNLTNPSGFVKEMIDDGYIFDPISGDILTKKN